MIRVLQIFPVSEIGGAEAVLMNIIRYRECHDIEYQAVLVADEDGPLGDALTRLEVSWQRVTRGRMRSPRALLRACLGLRQAVRNARADVLLTNSSQGFLYARLATMGMNVPVVIYYMFHPNISLFKNSMLDVLMALFRPSATFTASKAIARIVKDWGLPNVQAVYHGTPVQEVQPSQMEKVKEALEQYGISAGDPLILLPGRLQPWKGQHILIAAMPSVLQKYPNAHAVLLGGTLFGQSLVYPAELQRQIAHLGLTERVHLVGHQPIRAWLERASVVVHASIEPDPFPNVCIEALAANRPVITNTISGTSEILLNGADALVVEPNNPAAVAAVIIKVLSDPDLAAQITEVTHHRYLSMCTPSHMVQPIETTLMRLYGRRQCEI